MPQDSPQNSSEAYLHARASFHKPLFQRLSLIRSLSVGLVAEPTRPKPGTHARALSLQPNPRTTFQKPHGPIHKCDYKHCCQSSTPGRVSRAISGVVQTIPSATVPPDPASDSVRDSSQNCKAKPAHKAAREVCRSSLPILLLICFELKAEAVDFTGGLP